MNGLDHRHRHQAVPLFFEKSTILLAQEHFPQCLTKTNTVTDYRKFVITQWSDTNH